MTNITQDRPLKDVPFTRLASDEAGPWDLAILVIPIVGMLEAGWVEYFRLGRN